MATKRRGKPQDEHSTSSRRGSTRWEFVVAMAAASAFFGAFAPGQPTGIAFFDVIERAVFAGAVTLFAAASRRWAWLILAGTATVFAATIWGHLIGAVALGFAMNAALRMDRRDRLTGAFIGTLSIQVLLRTSDIGFFGATAIITGLAVSTVMLSGYRMMRNRNKHRLHIAIGVIAAAAALASAGFLLAAARASVSVNSAIASAQRGLDSASDAQQNDAANSWLASHRYFNEANALLSTPFAKVVYAVPVLSQQAQVVTTATGSGAKITDFAAHAATVAPYRSLRAADGTFDLAAIESMVEPVSKAQTAMIKAQRDLDNATTPWLFANLSTKVQSFDKQLASAIPQSRDALRALRAAPELLGANGPRHYLILFANPAEARGMGGFIGAWAELSATNGKLKLVRKGKMNALDTASAPSSRHITGEAEFMRRYGHLQPARFIQNISASPDFPTVARVAEQLYPQAGGRKIDGVMYVDPFALASLLDLAGLVRVPGVPEPITSKNVARFLMHDQYIDFPINDERADLLSDVAQATFEALTTRPLPSVLKISNTLSPMVHQRRLLATVTNRSANRYLESIDLTGAFPRADGGDFVSIRTSNGSANKVDYFVRQISTYTAVVNSSTGVTKGSLGITLSNTAPASGLSTYVLGNQDTRAGRTNGRPFGSVTSQVSVYSALAPQTMKVNGKTVGMQVQRELGSWVATRTVTIPPGGTILIELTTQGDLPTDQPYRLTWSPQASAIAPGYVVSISKQAGKSGKTIPILRAGSPSVVTRHFQVPINK